MRERTNDSTTVDEAAPGEDLAIDRTGTLAGPYFLESRIGDGGLADVYRARHPDRDLTLAVKVAKSRASTVVKKRFEREARILMSLRHPNIVSGVDSGIVDGAPFIVMPFIEGETMKAVVERDGRLTTSRALRFATQIASGLRLAHDANLIHRDLKPLNLIVSREPGGEIVRILDFGIARAYEGEEMRTRLTGDGLTGTPNYMAPEQVVTSVKQGPGVDLYALGAIICYMLTGSPPFSGSLLDVLRAHVHKKPPDLSEYGPLGEIATALMQKRPEDRPTSAAEVLTMLSGIDETIALELGPLDGETVAATLAATAVVEELTPDPRPLAERVASTNPVVIAQVREDRPWPLPLLVLLFVVVAAGVAMGVSWYFSGPPESVPIAPVVPVEPAPRIEVRPAVVPAPRSVEVEVEPPPSPPPPRRPPRVDRTPKKPKPKPEPVEAAPPRLSQKQRLQIVRSRLSRLVDHLSEKEFGVLEERYLALSERAAKAPNDPATLSSLSELERDTKRLVEAFR